MKRNEIWTSIIGREGARCSHCGDVPKVGSRLNGYEVRLVVPQPYNQRQFLAVLAGMT